MKEEHRTQSYPSHIVYESTLRNFTSRFRCFATLNWMVQRLGDTSVHLSQLNANVTTLNTIDYGIRSDHVLGVKAG